MKKIFFLVIIIGVLIILINQFSVTEVDKKIEKNWEEKQVLELLSNNEEIRKLITFEILNHHSISIEKGDNSSVGFHLIKGQKKVNNGIRSELSIDYPYNEGELISYKWDILIPKDFKNDAPKNRFWAIGQWHDQPDINTGETWDNFSSKSPPIGIYYGFMEGKNYFSLEYLNNTPSKEDLIEITPGEWMNIQVDILWSQTDIGYTNMYINGNKKPQIQKKGKNMHNGFQHYFKLGMYRDKNIQTNNSIFIRNISIQK